MNTDLDIVFVTSHKEYALDAFDVYPLDYIVKPSALQSVGLERLRYPHLEKMIVTR